MFESKHRKAWGASLVLAGITLLGVPHTEAHPRAVRHHHRKPVTAVIVVGDPVPVSRTVVVNGQPRGTLDMNVKPKATEVWVDGRYRGPCSAFDGYPGKLHLAPGLHDVKLVTPDGVEVERQIRVRAGIELNVGLDLR